MTTRLLVCIFWGLGSCAASAQSFQSVFPGLSGDELTDSVASNYRPGVVLDYANARDTLYASILSLEDDSLRCIYSGYTLYLDPAQDPTQYIYQNGTSLGMNTEHAYPQSKGAADGNPRSDMHHLFPARIPVNEARGDAPYKEIPDAQTQKWFRGTQVLTSIPAQGKDGYSESRVGIDFEPRESVKGDLARAIFYFYTVYRSQANAADPNYFESQRLTLCQWQKQDPADSAELIKTWRIAPYQDGKPNPFVLDCTLAHRCWCPETPTTCVAVSTQTPVIQITAPQLSPNPVSGGSTALVMQLPFDGELSLTLRSMTGQEWQHWKLGAVKAGGFETSIEVPEAFAARAGILEINLRGERNVAKGVLKMIGGY